MAYQPSEQGIERPIRLGLFGLYAMVESTIGWFDVSEKILFVD